jgi:nucleoside 2-deoxyribosyltransferase
VGAPSATAPLGSTEPALSAPLRVFLVQPFDEWRPKREELIKRALERDLAPYLWTMDTSDADRGSNWLRDALFDKIVAADLVIVDACPPSNKPDGHGRPNVYVELGFALALEKPVILIEPKEDRGHSDLQGFYAAVQIARPLTVEKREEALSNDLPGKIGPIRDWMLETKFRGALERVLLRIGDHTDHLRANVPELGQAYIIQGGGPLGLRAVVKCPTLPRGIILELRSGTSEYRDEFLGLATNWERNSYGHYTGDILFSSPRELLSHIRQKYVAGSEAIEVRVKIWEGRT